MLFAAIAIVALLASSAAVRTIVRKVEATYPPPGQFATVGGCRYHYEVAGDGLPVVLLHGMGASLEDYHHGVFEALATEFRVIAIDRPGHGHSERPRGDAGAPVTQAGSVHEVVKKIGIDRALIVGHSWSGALALAYALEYPAATLGVVLVQGTLYPQTAVLSPMLRMLSTPAIGPLFAYTLMPFTGRGAIRRTLERAFHPQPVPPDYLRRAQAMWTRPRQALAIAVDARRRAETIAELAMRYGKISQPISLVIGAADRFIDPAGQSFRFAREIPASRVHVVPDAGHQIPQTRPHAVVEAVRALANDLKISWHACHAV